MRGVGFLREPGASSFAGLWVTRRNFGGRSGENPNGLHLNIRGTTMAAVFANPTSLPPVLPGFLGPQASPEIGRAHV